MFDSFPVCRTLFKHWIYDDAEYLKVWITMLSQARYLKEPKTVIYEKALCTLNYGEFIFGYKAWSKKTKISYQRLRGFIEKLKADNMLVVSKQTNRFTVYSIVNYEKFNSPLPQNSEGNFPKSLNFNSLQTLTESAFLDDDNNPVTPQQQPSNNPVTTNKEGIRKIKKEKKVLKDIYVSQFKPPTIEEVKAYCLERNNNVDANTWHDFYSSKGWMVGKNKMKDWKAAVRTWEHKDNQSVKPKNPNFGADRTPKRGKYEEFYL